MHESRIVNRNCAIFPISERKNGYIVKHPFRRQDTFFIVNTIYFHNNNAIDSPLSLSFFVHLYTWSDSDFVLVGGADERQQTRRPFPRCPEISCNAQPMVSHYVHNTAIPPLYIIVFVLCCVVCAKSEQREI